MCKITEKKISKCLKEMGMPVSIIGFEYIKAAITELATDKNFACRKHLGDLYSRIAEKYGTEPSKIERNVCYAIEKVYLCGDFNLINEMLGFPDDNKDKLTNGEFIFALFEYLRYDD